MIQKKKQEEIEGRKMDFEYARPYQPVDEECQERGGGMRTLSLGSGGRVHKKEMSMSRKSRAVADMMCAPPMPSFFCAPTGAPAVMATQAVAMSDAFGMATTVNAPTRPQVEASTLLDRNAAVDSLATSSPDPTDSLDFTQIPVQLDGAYDRLDVDNALRPTVINPSSHWMKKTQKALLSPVNSVHLGPEEITTEKNKAFDLLDALSRSGALTMGHSSLHVVIAATHCFDKEVMECAIQDSINPIEKVERSTLIMSSVIHQTPINQLVPADQLSRIQLQSPLLLE